MNYSVLLFNVNQKSKLRYLPKYFEDQGVKSVSLTVRQKYTYVECVLLNIQGRPSEPP